MPYKFNPFTGKLDNSPGAPVFNDAKFTIFDDGNKTKRFQFEASAISPSTTRTLDIQDVDGPVAIGFGTASQYIRGDATIGNFPGIAGGGTSVSYYFNGSVSQGTILANPYYEINRIPANAVQTNFTINAGNTTAYFITDASDPALLLIPQGNFTFQLYCSTSSGNPQLAVELYKYDGAAFTQIGVTSPAATISNTTSDIHLLTVFVPSATTLALTDRLAVRVIGSSLGGHTITLNTEGNTQSQIITTFSTGLAALNGLTDQVQFFSTGTTGTDFNIASAAATHTFNIPVASAANTGKLSAADWTAFNGKVGPGLYTASALTMNTARILARTTAGVGAAEEISVGTGLSLTAGVLSNTAAGVTSVTATAPITSSGGATPDISTSMNTNRLIGRTTAGTGVMEEISTAGTLTLTGGTLTGTGVGGSVGAVDNAVLRADVGTGVVQNSSIIIDDETTTTQNNVAIRNNDSQTNSALVLSPKGTGAFILGPKPDGTATGGNARGANAVDLQTFRLAATEICGTLYSAIAGGSRNTIGGSSIRNQFIGAGNLCTISASQYNGIVSGDQNSITAGQGSFIGSGVINNCAAGESVIGGGRLNSTAAQYGTSLGGYHSRADRYGMQAHANGAFGSDASSRGDAQRARFVLRQATSSATPATLFLDGSSTRLTIPSNKVFGFTVNICGTKQGLGEQSMFVRKGYIKNVAGTTSLIGTIETIGTDIKTAGATTTDVALTADDTNDALQINVIGVTGENWRWVASVDAVEISY